MTPIRNASTTAEHDDTSRVPLLGFDLYSEGAEDARYGEDATLEAASRPGTSPYVELAVDRIERQFTRRPAFDAQGTFYGSAPRAGRAPVAFVALGADPVADGLTTSGVLDALRWTTPDRDDD